MNATDLLVAGVVLIVGGLWLDAVGPLPGVGVGAFWLGAGLLLRGFWLVGRAAERDAREQKPR